jgi:hypothetical protein
VRLEAFPTERTVPTLPGLALVVLGVLGAAALADLMIGVSASGAAEIGVGSASFTTTSFETTLAIAVALAAVATALVVLGVVVIVRSRRGRELPDHERVEADVQRLETMRRLLEERVDMLAAQAKELDRSGRELEDARVVVLPDAP